MSPNNVVLQRFEHCFKCRVFRLHRIASTTYLMVLKAFVSKDEVVFGKRVQMAKVFSAPGKALLAGGYLVLDPSYDAYVTALSSRMHAIIEGESKSDCKGLSSITIQSPQFQEGEWRYDFELGDFERGVQPSEVHGRINPFAEATVATIVSYIKPTERYEVKITVYSDPGYHSQQNTTLKTSTNGKKRFLYHPHPIAKVAKTGLGSSAGLVSVLTTALISFFKPSLDITSQSSKDLIHNLAQVAHCIAQKKIGSGFDVAAAVYGSIIYKRFQPELIDELLKSDSKNVNYSEALSKLVESRWEFNSERCGLPPFIKLLMGDVCGGSETPKLVSKVLNWKANNLRESSELYHDLNAANEQLIESLSNLSELHKTNPTQYMDSINYLSQNSAKIWSSELEVDFESKVELKLFLELIDSIRNIRNNLRALTVATGADIEPIQQTKLLDQCNNLNGVLGGVVPGAGGYDAICLLVIEDCISSIVAETSNDKTYDNVTWLNLHEEDEGITQENLSDYEGL